LEENNGMESIELIQKSSTMFYYKLGDFLNPAYHVPQHYHDDLRNASYTYFNSLIILDGVVDNSISSLKLYEATNGIERSIRLLSAFFQRVISFGRILTIIKINIITH
jgi:predicted nucleotidyltransferase